MEITYGEIIDPDIRGLLNKIQKYDFLKKFENLPGCPQT